MAKLLQSKGYDTGAATTVLKRCFYDGINLYSIEDYVDGGITHSRFRLLDINGGNVSNVTAFNFFPSNSQIGNYGFAVNPNSAAGQPRYFFGYSLPANDNGDTRTLTIALYDFNRVLIGTLNTSVEVHFSATEDAIEPDNVTAITYNTGEFRRSDLIYANGSLYARYNNTVYEISTFDGSILNTINLDINSANLTAICSIVYDLADNVFWAMGTRTNEGNILAKFSSFDGSFISSFSDDRGAKSNNPALNHQDRLIQVPRASSYVLKMRTDDVNETFTFYGKVGDPSRVSISVPVISVPADGIFAQDITVALFDADNNPVPNTNVSLEVAGYLDLKSQISATPTRFTGSATPATVDSDNSTGQSVDISQPEHFWQYDNEFINMQVRVVKAVVSATSDGDFSIEASFLNPIDVVIATETKTIGDGTKTVYFVVNQIAQKVKLSVVAPPGVNVTSFEWKEVGIAVGGNFNDGNIFPANGVTNIQGQLNANYTAGIRPGDKHIVATASF